jgi:putative ABC transport system permease protein
MSIRSTLMGVFAVTALLLGAVRIYGVIAYAVLQRTPGDRHPYGARRNHIEVVRLVVGQGSRMALAGIITNWPERLHWCAC